MPHQNIAIPFGMEKLDGGATRWCKNFEDMYNPLHTIPTCDGRTGILPRHSQWYAYVSCGKNETIVILNII